MALSCHPGAHLKRTTIEEAYWLASFFPEPSIGSGGPGETEIGSGGTIKYCGDLGSTGGRAGRPIWRWSGPEAAGGQSGRDATLRLLEYGGGLPGEQGVMAKAPSGVLMKRELASHNDKEWRVSVEIPPSRLDLS